jgi:hypothetical protein
MITISQKGGASFVLALAIFWTACNLGQAAKLDSSGWIVQKVGLSGQNQLVPPTDLQVYPTGQAPTQQSSGAAQIAAPWWQVLFDNNPSTMVTLTNFAASPNVPGLLIDMGQTNAVSRVVINGTNNALKLWPNSQSQTNPPLGLILAYVGMTSQTMTNVAEFTIPPDSGNTIDTPMDLRFSPVVGRFVEVLLQTKVTWGNSHWPGYGPNFQPPAVDTAWNIGELELYGSTGPGAQAAFNAVVLETNAPAPLVLAAQDLSYYLGELTGLPHPIITPKQTNNFTGTLYCIADLKPLAPDYQTMTNNLANGTLPTNEVNVTKSGRVVAFTGWPYRCVLWSVWEFLERQGVRWVYPDNHGDYVPTGNGVNLGILPLTFSSCAKSIYANWPATDFLPWPPWELQSTRQEYLYVWRNRWTSTFGGSDGPLGGAEIPAMLATGVPLNSQYTESFAGYPHNSSAVVPQRILTNNPSWWGSADGTNYSPTAALLDMASPDAAAWIAGKVIACDASCPLPTVHPLNTLHYLNAYNFLPMDAIAFSKDTDSLAADALYGSPIGSGVPWITGNSHSSGSYYQLLSSVANIATNQIIGGLAYSDIFQPSASNYPPNVQMEVCLYGSPNLPLTSPANTSMKSALDTWSQRSSRLATYDYSLLHIDYWQGDPRLPVPMVNALVEKAQYLAGIGALNGGCQATDVSIQYNPWNFYAYPRIRWDTNQTSPQIEQEFFTGYYKEAAAPMLAYYQAMENYQVSNNADMHFIGYCYWANPGTFPLYIMNQMQTNLQAAQALATNWYVINRINDATNCFNWLLTQRGVTNLSILTNFSVDPVVPATGTYSVNLSSGFPVNNPAGFYSKVDAVIHPNSWQFDGASMIQETLNFPAAGQYLVNVVSYCNYYNGGWPTMRVFLGPSCSGSIPISSSTAVTNSFVATVSSPTALDLVVTQDSSGKFLNVTQIQITAQ